MKGEVWLTSLSKGWVFLTLHNVYFNVSGFLCYKRIALSIIGSLLFDYLHSRVC